MPALTFRLSPLLRGGLAQLGERLLCTQEVRGSNPLASTMSDRDVSAILAGAFLLGVSGCSRASPITPGDPERISHIWDPRLPGEKWAAAFSKDEAQGREVPATPTGAAARGYGSPGVKLRGRVGG